MNMLNMIILVDKYEKAIVERERVLRESSYDHDKTKAKMEANRVQADLENEIEKLMNELDDLRRKVG
jgi:hypothetical protein